MHCRTMYSMLGLWNSKEIILFGGEIKNFPRTAAAALLSAPLAQRANPSLHLRVHILEPLFCSLVRIDCNALALATPAALPVAVSASFNACHPSPLRRSENGHVSSSPLSSLLSPALPRRAPARANRAGKPCNRAVRGGQDG